MKQLIITIGFVLFGIMMTTAQTITGRVINNLDEPLFGATIIWEGTTIAAFADENGQFELPQQDTTANLQIDYVGYDPIFIEVLPHETELNIVIDGITELMEVEVAAKRRDNYTSTLSTLNIETIGADEFRKAPCCNLAESFQTNASIDVAYNDAVTGAREIMLLGLRGTYTQMLVEKRPGITGLGSAFAMEYIPGTWLSGIQIAKGPSTVQNGYQAITGQINAELVKPFEDDRLFINLYTSTFGRTEANVHLNHQFNKKFSAGLLLHGSTRRNELDGNNDNFYDTPQKDMLDGMFRLFYRGDVLRSQINVHAISDRHTAGQIAAALPDGVRPFLIGQDHDRIEVFGKIGYLGFEKLYNTTGFIYNAAYHKLNSFYGDRFHSGVQRNVYLNWMYSTIIGNTNHKFDYGATYLFDQYDEQLNDTDFSRTEKVPGAFAEYTYKGPKLEGGERDFASSFGAVLGLRVDYHNLFGWLITPRGSVKYNFSDDSVIRFSAGRGYRTANVIAENIGMLASSRMIRILDNLEMEDAWNYGFNYTQNFTIGEQEGSFVFDAYHTNFNNQVVLDMDSDYRFVDFYNLDGQSYSNSLLAVLSYELFKGFDFKLGYKFNDVKTTYQGVLRQRPMVAKHRGLIVIDYETPDEKWELNTNMQLVGQSRFADVIDNPYHTDEQHIGTAPAYAVVNAQLTYRITEKFELYAGAENLTNFRQPNPIIDWENPFGEYFDATHIYAPITGAMGFLGVRYGIE